MNKKFRQLVPSSLLPQLAALAAICAASFLAWPYLEPDLLATAGYHGHGESYLWQPNLVFLHVASDATIALSYLVISGALATLVWRARATLPFRWLFLAFGIFIVACGITHAVEVVTVYRPFPWLAGGFKLITAVASVATAVAFVPMLRPILDFFREVTVSSQRKDELERVNRVLENEVAERKRAQEQLVQVQERFLGIYTSSKDAIGFGELSGRMIDVNPAFERLVGYSRDEVLAGDYQRLTPPEYYAMEAQHVKRVLESGQPAEYEKEYVRKNGTRVPIELTTFAVRNSSGETIGLAAVVRDISERRAATRAQVAQTDELNRSNQELEQFASVASHDLQEPLRKIQMFGARLEKQSGEKLGEESRHSLEKMLDAARRMDTLIQDLLSLSRITSKTRPFASVDLNKIVGGVLSDLEARIAQSNAQIEVGILPTIFADAPQMRQLFQNLVGNALKFGRPEIAPQVRISATMDGDICTLSVEDNGIGFEAQHAQRIFEPFQRLHGRSAYEGTGIGLSICRKIVERHGGNLRAQSTPGEGTTFFVTLPLGRNGL